MPYSSEYVTPEVFVKHRGVVVYHTYKNDDLQAGARTYGYTVNDECGEDSDCGECDDKPHTFDVRDMPCYKEIVDAVRPEYINSTKDKGAVLKRKEKAWSVYHRKEDDLMKRVVKHAIESGVVTKDGVKP